jgi:serine/threonine protein kinase
MQENSNFQDKYLIGDLLGSGGFGSVYKTIEISSQLSYAIKIDKKRKGNVKQEAQILLELQTGDGIPKVFEVGETVDFTYMVMELLGISLSKHQRQQQGGKFSIDMIIPILVQAIDRLEFIHSMGIVHRDLKPQQFLFGCKNKLYLVDYGLARKFVVNGSHIPYQCNCSRAGNSTYASLSNHMGIHQTRRDDIESLSYMAVSLFSGRLPWQQSSKLASNIKWDNVFQIKSGIPLQELCQNCPKEFLSFIRYARSLEFNEKPNYEYLRNLINGIGSLETILELKPESKKKIRRNRREENSEDEAEPVRNKNLFVLFKSKSKKIN